MSGQVRAANEDSRPIGESTMLQTILKTTFPALLSVLLIGIALFALLLPKLQTALMDQKVAMVRSMAQSAWSILDALHARVENGELTLEEAQGTAKSIVHSMRYDDEGRNYFWILDYGHVTLVHPYQPEHLGRDLSGLTDITGKQFIVEMVQGAREHGEVLVSYHWEVMDDPHNIELKYAYATNFQPWGWVLGTGVYMVDVRQEIGRITRYATFFGVGILLLVSAIALFFTWRRLMVEQNRLQTVEALRKSEEQYRALTENSLDTIMRFDRDFRHTYVNKMAAVLTGIPVEDWIDKTHRELGFPEELNRLWEKTLARVFETGEVQRIEFMLPNGIWIDWLCIPELDANMQVQGAVTTARDITDRKKTEEAMRESEERFSKAFNASPAPLVISDIATGRFIDVNERWVQLLGHSKEEQIGRTSKEVGIWADPKQRDRIVQKLGTHGSFKDEPTVFKTKAGQTLSALWSAEVITLAGQEVMLSMIYDETERRQFEKALKESEERYRLLSDMTMEGILIHKQGVAVDMNTSLARVLGYERQELIGKNVIQLVVHEEDLGIVQSNIVKGYAQPYMVRCLKKNGQLFFAELEARNFEVNGEVLRVAAVRDVTKRVQAEKALRESQDRLANVMVAINDGIWDWDLETNTVYFDSRYYTMAGYEPDEFPHDMDQWARRVHPEDLERCRLKLEEHFSQKTKQFDIEFRFLKKDGDWLWVRGRGKVVRWDTQGNPTRMVGTHTDITDRRLAEESHKRLQAQLNQAQKMESVGILAGGVAHDFNNLMQAMSGNIQMLLMGKPEDDPETERLKAVSRSIDRAADLVRQLLLFSRKAEGKRDPVNLNRETEEAIEMLERTIPRMVAIEVHLQSGLWPISADPVQIEQVLLNLGGNAADAMPEGGNLVIETRNVVLDEDFVRMNAEAKTGEYVMLTVSDTGEGMDKETQKHIFDPFYTTKEVGKGTGLGLASVYGIVKGHGGFILCYSEKGLGTTFRIYWPAMQGAESMDTDAAPEQEQVEGGSETILVVDDERDIRELTSEALEAHGYRTLTAINGEEALAVYAENKASISMVVLDLGMPGMGGQQCLAELLRIDPKARVLIASGYSADGRDVRVIEAGAKEFIGKPYRINDLLTKVRQILDGVKYESGELPG